MAIGRRLLRFWLAIVLFIKSNMRKAVIALDALAPEETPRAIAATFEEDAFGLSLNVTKAVEGQGARVALDKTVPLDMLDASDNPRLVIEFVERGETYKEVVIGKCDLYLKKRGEYTFTPAAFGDRDARFFARVGGTVEEISETIDTFSGRWGDFGACHREDNTTSFPVGIMSGGRDMVVLSTSKDRGLTTTTLRASDTIEVRGSYKQ